MWFGLFFYCYDSQSFSSGGGEVNILAAILSRFVYVLVSPPLGAVVGM